jgi:hypothetical protein
MKNNEIYLVAFHYAKPRPGVQTQLAGWQKDPNNFYYDERVEITRGLKRDAVTSSSIVLNLSTKTVLKDRSVPAETFDDKFKYFFKGYHQYITAVMSKLDAEYFNSMLDAMQVEEDSKTVQPAE